MPPKLKKKKKCWKWGENIKKKKLQSFQQKCDITCFHIYFIIALNGSGKNHVHVPCYLEFVK